MTDWRQWLDEKMLAVDLALDHLPATLSEKMTLIDKTVRELSEGYRLLAEAVEAAVRGAAGGCGAGGNCEAFLKVRRVLGEAGGGDQ